MTLYDGVMLTLFIGAVLHGYWKGLAWQVASVAAIVVGYIVAVNFRSHLAGMLPIEEPWDRIGAMLILFLLCSLAVWITYGFVSRSMEKLELKGFDHQAGALVGGITGALLCMVVTIFSVSLIGDEVSVSIRDSRLGPYIVTGIDEVNAAIPEEMAPYVHRYVEEWYRVKPEIAAQPNDSGFISGASSIYPRSGQTQAFQPQGGWTSTGQQAGYTSGGAGGVAPSGYQTGGLDGTGEGSRWSSDRDPDSSRVWSPPKIEIKVDSEDLLEGFQRLFERRRDQE